MSSTNYPARSVKPKSMPNGGFIVHHRAANGRIVTPKRRPMFEHDSYDAACNEADRLAELRGGTFTVFEATYSARAPERPAPVVDKSVATIAAVPMPPPETTSPKKRPVVVERKTRRTAIPSSRQKGGAS